MTGVVTIAEVRFAISQKFREIEGLVDLLQNDLGSKTKELETLKAKETEEKKD